MESQNNSTRTSSNQNTVDSGLTCLVMMARYHQISCDPAQIAHHHIEKGSTLSLSNLLLAAKDLSLKAKVIRSNVRRLERVSLPAIATANDGSFFIIARYCDSHALIHNPQSGRSETVQEVDLQTFWSGDLVLVASRASITGELSRFDFSWFLPALIKYRRMFSEILVISLFLQLLALASPIFFQVVMDKVIVHHALSTLDVLCFGLLGLVVFESMLSGLRAYIFSHTTSRVDVELGSKLFKHLLGLPAAYFHSRRVGDTVARVRELETIRTFLTSSMLTLVIDCLFSVVFIAVMAHYSGWLTAILLCSLPAYFIISLAIFPTLRQSLSERFNRGAENQAFLVESVTAIDVLKSMSLEPQMNRRWDSQLAAYVQSNFRASTIAAIGQELVGLINKLVTVAILWYGARLVLNGELTIGGLIAFNMLANRVSLPIMRLAHLWSDFQQTGISIQRLGDILNARTELRRGSQQTLPRIRGDIRFEDVNFRYGPERNLAIKNLNIQISAGEVIGVVGKSGSGKSTITKLVQRIFTPESGRVLIDDTDVAIIEPSSLRRQIGVVLQENSLFNRTIRENIAITDTSRPLTEVIETAKLAGAHEFILDLPEGYDTVVSEQGANLSGGQRQRISLARALFTNPRILILDEATSALDYESERAIINNMPLICKNRTVIIVAHRLSSVRFADRIVVLDKGSIVEDGTHDVLLERQAGHYARFHRMQGA